MTRLLGAETVTSRTPADRILLTRKVHVFSVMGLAPSESQHILLLSPLSLPSGPLGTTRCMTQDVIDMGISYWKPQYI